MKTTIIAVLSTAVVGMVAFWLVQGQDYISRADASEMIRKESPYVQDQKLILDKLTQVVQVNKELQETLADLRSEVVELKTILRQNNGLRQTHNLLPETEVRQRSPVLRTGRPNS